jgi:hypothetical protein
MQNPEQIHSAIDSAIAAIREIYKDEKITDIEVEEIEQESRMQGLELGDWLVTIGFNWQKPRAVLGGLAIPQRTLKVVKIDPETGDFKGMKIRNPST